MTPIHIQFMQEEHERTYRRRKDSCNISGLQALLVLSPWRVLR